MEIHSRKSWGARRPRPRDRQEDSQIREFFLHYPAAGHDDLADIDRDQEQDAYLRGVQNFHMDGNGWSDIGYSFAVFQDGEVCRLRGRRWVPAAQFGHNTGTIAVLCVVGNDEQPSPAMVRSLRALKNQMDKAVGRDLRVRGHGEVVATACPGPHVRGIIATLQNS